MWILFVIAAVVGYLLGNLNGAVITSKLNHDDVRNHGSGNAGLTNFIRNYGAAKALLVIVLDAGKALLSCLIGALLLKNRGMWTEGAIIGGAGAMLGHAFPVFLGFRGGKGILSAFFIALFVDWRVALIALAIFAIAYLPTGLVSLGSVLGATTYSVCFVLFHLEQPVVMICGGVMGVLAIYLHKQNIVRLIQGKERKTNLFKKDKAE